MHSKPPKVKYTIGAFALLSAFLFYEYLEIQIKGVGDNPYSEIILPALVLASIMFFFLAIVRKNNSISEFIKQVTPQP